MKYLAADNAAASQSYFCSELIATAYIMMEVLGEKYAPSRYFPVDFSCERELPWTKGSYLEYEYMIDMTL